MSAWTRFARPPSLLHPASQRAWGFVAPLALTPPSAPAVHACWRPDASVQGRWPCGNRQCDAASSRLRGGGRRARRSPAARCAARGLAARALPGGPAAGAARAAGRLLGQRVRHITCEAMPADLRALLRKSPTLYGQHPGSSHRLLPGTCLAEECGRRVSLALIQDMRRCATFTGASEADLKLHTCSGCGRARYCGPLCQKAAWRAHRAACRRREAARE